MSEKLVRVLYVEDDADIQTVASLALETLGGLTLEICSSGSEAVEKITAFDPQLILLDVMMPGMDGPTTLGELRKIPAFTDTPVIFMTAKVQPGEVAGYKALGAVDVIPKPFDPMTLAEQVNAIWAGRHG